MFRKTLLLAMLALTGAMLAGHARFEPSQAAQDKAAAKEPPYTHVVIFYLKPDAPKDAAAGMIADAHQLLAKIPSVRGIKCGRPAEKATPDFAKSDYQVGLAVLFDNFEGLDAYLKHDLHTEYVKRHLKHVDEKKLLVYDFSNQQK
jgi:hypothetical protein